MAALRDILRRNRDLVHNASSLAATTGVTSGLGFAYWVYAARFFTGAAVGYGTAAISTMTLLGTVGMFGIGTMLVGKLPRTRPRGPLMTAGLITSFAGALVLGIGFTLVSLAFGTKFVEINGTPLRAATFIFGVAITGATLVFDEATIGLLRGGLQLSRNVTVSIAKMATLPVSALALHDLFGLGIMLSWVSGTLISLIPVVIMIKRDGTKILYRPDWRQFWQLRKLTLAHNSLNLAIATPGKLIPVLVSIVVLPHANAAYYITTMLSSFLFMVPMHLSTVLFAIASATPEKIAEKLRFVLRTSLIIGVPSGLVLALSSHFILSAFGPSYASLATVPLLLQIVGYIPGTPNVVYIAVCRATGRVNQAAVFLAVFATLQMGALVVGGRLGGLDGLSIGMLAITWVPQLIGSLVHIPVRQRRSGVSGAL
jgi:O-antigen/teichoic acid export membrane protein